MVGKCVSKPILPFLALLPSILSVELGFNLHALTEF